MAWGDSASYTGWEQSVNTMQSSIHRRKVLYLCPQLLTMRKATTASSTTIMTARRNNRKRPSTITYVTTIRSFAKRSNPGDQKKQEYRKPTDDEVTKKLAWVENRLQQVQVDQALGKRRGKDEMKKMLRNEATSKRHRRNVNSKVAEAEIKSLLYARHALQHGELRLKDLVLGGRLARSFLGNDTKENMTVKHAKQILLEQFRYGDSSLLETYVQKHNARLAQKHFTQEKQAAAAARRRAAKQESNQQTQKDSD